MAGATRLALFLFCALLPWTWFSASLLESANVLIAGGNLIRKVMFPAEVLPIVTVLAGFVHYCLGLVVLAAFFVYYRHPVPLSDLPWLPVIVLVQAVLTLGLSLLIAALTVHFRDLRDLLANVMTLWFFALFFVRARAKSLWHDELYTALMSRFPVVTLWRANLDGVDLAPPLYTLITHVLHVTGGPDVIVTRLTAMVMSSSLREWTGIPQGEIP
jgi:ABC-type polysaccharide/polyol phosphate export permease